MIAGVSPAEVSQWTVRTAGIPNIRFVGHLAHSKVHDFARECDVLLAPYQHQVSVSGGGGDTGRWMSPLKLFEYMACMAPSLSSNHGQMKDIISDGVDGLLCENTPEDILEKILFIKKNPEQAKNIARNGWERIQSELNWQHNVDETLKCFERAICERRDD